MVECQCKSPEDALKLANAGLDKAYESFQFVDADGKTCSFKEVMASPAKDKFHTGFIKGELATKSNTLEVGYKGKSISGEEQMD